MSPNESQAYIKIVRSMNLLLELEQMHQMLMRRMSSLDLPLAMMTCGLRLFQKTTNWRYKVSFIHLQGFLQNDWKDISQVLMKLKNDFQLYLQEDDARSGSSSPDSTGSVESSISSHFGGMNYPSLFSSKPSSQATVSYSQFLPLIPFLITYYAICVNHGPQLSCNYRMILCP